MYGLGEIAYVSGSYRYLRNGQHVPENKNLRGSIIESAVRVTCRWWSVAAITVPNRVADLLGLLLSISHHKKEQILSPSDMILCRFVVQDYP